MKLVQCLYCLLLIAGGACFSPKKHRPTAPSLSMVKNPFGGIIPNPFVPSESKSAVNLPTSPPAPPKSSPPSTQPPKPKPPSSSTMPSSSSKNKFDMAQRFESVKCAVIGALSGSIAVAPITFLHYVGTSLPQFELATDMAALQGALFAIVYRYAIRNDDNPMLNQGVWGAFVLVRTLPAIQVSPECSAFPLSCGAPIGYFDWSMLTQGVVQGVESAVLFGGVYLAVEYAFSKGWISKFD